MSNPDVTAPQVTITSPANGSTVSGSVQVTATATDNIGVAGVQFKVDGAALNGELSSGPYATTWNTGSMKNGSHQVSAVVRDAAGNQSTSTISINVGNSDSTAPQAAITAPANGATVSGMVAVSATATDNIGVAGVQFYVDGAALGQESTSAPFSTSWNAAAAAPGTHQLSAVARDAAGNRATCATVTVTIPAAATPAGGWANRKKITIKAAQVSGDQVNFPVLVNLASDAGLAASAQTTGGDIYFTSASGVKLAHEIERFQKSTGSLAAWVNIPALSSTTDTVIYMYYGNASAADQQNRTAVWDSGDSAVWHMREGSAQHVDSTANANQSQTVSVAASGGTAGQIGMADQFSRAQLSHITIPGSTSLRQPTLTVEAWVKANSAVSGAQDVISFGDDVTLRIEWNGAASFYVYDGGYRWMTGTADLRGGYHHIAGVIDGTAKTLTIYVDGIAQGSVPSSSPAYVHGANVEIGMNAYPSTAYNFDGNIDEARVSKTARSAAWIKTAYTNQSSSTFCTAGTEEKLITGDKTAPQVAITAPSNGATVSGIVAISATATDNVGVLGVQFSVDGKALGSESTSAPYSSSWNTTGVAAGTHQLSAVARTPPAIVRHLRSPSRSLRNRPGNIARRSRSKPRK